ncbi:MAG: DUF4390 domain-containing protein, partial [Deltaproteobacteria bacterium]|nr:DUF4390 domain-containing protein [Deltaproteobacteria bacterium]
MRKPFALAISFFAAVAWASLACASDAIIEGVKTQVNGADAVVSFAVRHAFSKDMEEAIKSGIPTSFTFRVELDRLNSIWFDEKEEDLRFRHTVKYDTLRDEYQV